MPLKLGQVELRLLLMVFLPFGYLYRVLRLCSPNSVVSVKELFFCQWEIFCPTLLVEGSRVYESGMDIFRLPAWLKATI